MADTQQSKASSKRKPNEYFQLIKAAKSAQSVDEAALNSLDIIDTKAGGLAGLIGGFSAAATFALQMGQPWAYGPNVDVLLLGLSLVLLALAGGCCAISLNIICHRDEGLFRTPSAADERTKLESIYDRRVTAYRIAHRSFLTGVILMTIGLGAMFAEASLLGPA